METHTVEMTDEQLTIVKRALEQYFKNSPDHQSNRDYAKELWIKLCAL